MNRTVKILIAIVVLLAVAGGSFYGGTLYGKNQAQTTFAAARQRGGAFPGAGSIVVGELPPDSLQQQGQTLGGALFGQIKEIGDGAMVISDNNGKQIPVKVTDTTLIEKQASVTLADLVAGETVFISGSTAADGTVTARSVQVAPAGRFGLGGPLSGRPAATPVP